MTPAKCLETLGPDPDLSLLGLLIWGLRLLQKPKTKAENTPED